VPEATTTCPSCGNEIDSAYQACPQCGAQQRQLGLFGKLQNAAGGLLATTKTNPKPWMIGGGAAAVAAIAAVVVFGGFLGPSGKDICTATLNQARDFGVISPSASLADTSAKKTDVKDRRQCTAKVGDDTYMLLVDLKSEDAEHKKCKDLKKQSGCVALYSVARSDGVMSYQVREIPPGETDEALAAQNPPPAAPDAAPGGEPGAAADPGGLDSDTAVDNSASTQSPPAAPQQ
jgi:hypothetical protein